MPHQIYTLANMQTILQDRYEGVVFWTATEATDAINEALLMWNLLTGMWTDEIDITTVADQSEYTLTASLVFGSRVEFNGRGLNKCYLSEMDNGRPGWRNQTTADGDVPDEPQNWTPLGLKRIAIWPADADGGNTLTVDGVAATPRLVNSGDYIDVGNELLNALLGYALHVIAFKEGGSRFAATMPLYFNFLEQAGKRNKLLGGLFEKYINTDSTRAQQPIRS